MFGPKQSCNMYNTNKLNHDWILKWLFKMANTIFCQLSVFNEISDCVIYINYS